MKKVFLLSLIFLFTGFTAHNSRKEHRNPPNSKASNLNKDEKKAFIRALKNGDCTYKDINLWGKVEFVDAFEDITIRYVDAFEDIRVEFVDNFPDECGQWEKVDAFPDFTVRVVEAFEDITVRKVDAFPGVD